MKTCKTIFLIFILIFIFISSQFSQAQDIKVHYMIGKKQNEVIKKYGNPVHRDDSNPEMLCMFYKNKLNTVIFVSDKKKVYQSEAFKVYDNNTSAKKALDDCISESVSDGFEIDSVTTSDFRLHKKGIKAELQFAENKLTGKFEVRIKARHSEN